MKRVQIAGQGMTSARTRDRLLERLRQQGIASPVVINAMRDVPRHIFVDEALASRAYEDTALPIGFGQTISQPYIVARMTEVLVGEGRLHKVLEVGTGSGYQTALLAQLADQVYSIERVHALIRAARARFMALGLRNIRLHHGDGHAGWPEYGPYDGILVAAAPRDIPQALLEQLALGARLVIPVGPSDDQQLQVVTRKAEGFDVAILDQVSFVPLRRGDRMN